MNSLKVKDFSLSLISYIKEYDLPMEVKRLVVKEIYQQIEQESVKELLIQIDERDKNKEENKDA